jgi:hypothetical protein
VVQDSLVEGSERVQFSRGEQVNEVEADILDVPRRRVLDGSAAGWQ